MNRRQRRPRPGSGSASPGASFPHSALGREADGGPCPRSPRTAATRVPQRQPYLLPRPGRQRRARPRAGRPEPPQLLIGCRPGGGSRGSRLAPLSGSLAPAERAGAMAESSARSRDGEARGALGRRGRGARVGSLPHFAAGRWLPPFRVWRGGRNGAAAPGAGRGGGEDEECPRARGAHARARRGGQRSKRVPVLRWAGGRDPPFPPSPPPALCPAPLPWGGLARRWLRCPSGRDLLPVGGGVSTRWGRFCLPAARPAQHPTAPVPLPRSGAGFSTVMRQAYAERKGCGLTPPSRAASLGTHSLETRWHLC